MPIDKEFKTITDQIRLLKSRGLQFNNVLSAKQHLQEKNYFNLINGLETLLLDDAKNSPKKYANKTFDNFLRLYEFDRGLASIIFQKISEFETKLKASIVYNFCKNHCSNLAENNNYININYYNIPQETHGPKEYVRNFYNESNSRRTHKLFRKDYKYEGIFRGTFNGDVIYNRDTTKISGTFSGRFGSTSIKEVKQGNCTFKNRRHSSLLIALQSVDSGSGKVSLPITINKDETIYGLNYIDHCKTKYSYVNTYNDPPFWVVVKSLMFNDLIILMYGLKKRTSDAVLRDFGLRPNDKEVFINSLEIIKELRNACAHFELINRFRTSTNLKINNRLISDLSLSPKRSNYIIKVYDALKVLQKFLDLYELRTFIMEYWNTETKYGNQDIVKAMLQRMGEEKIDKWI